MFMKKEDVQNMYLSPQKLPFVRKKQSSVRVEEYESDDSEIKKNFSVNYQEQLHLDDKRARMMIIGKMKAVQDEKEVQNDDFFMIIDQNSIEKIDSMSGRCLTLRKTVMKVKVHTNHLAMFIIGSKFFDAISLFVILCNSIQLALEDPTSDQSLQVMDILDNIFLAFYTTEMVLKILAKGLMFNKGAYLRDPWNILDCIIVLVGLLQLMFAGNNSVNLGGLRAFRILRPLKTISGIEGLRVIVSALISSSQNLIEAFVVLYIGYLIFSITGLQLFMGSFKMRCIEVETGQVHPDGDLCGKKACPDGYMCGKTNSNINYEQTSFDTIFYSFISVYQCVSMEGWTSIQKDAQKSYSDISWAFFCPLSFIVAYFLLQLTQAVISNAFQNQHQSKDEIHEAKKKKKKKVLKDFENLDEKERQRLLEEQEESRRSIMRKWRRIYLVKSGLLRFIKAFKRRKQEEEQESAREAKLTQRRNKMGVLNLLRYKTDIPQNGKTKGTSYQINEKEVIEPEKNQSNFQKKYHNQASPEKNSRILDDHIKKNYQSSPDKVMRLMGMVGIKPVKDSSHVHSSLTNEIKIIQDQINQNFHMNAMSDSELQRANFDLNDKNYIQNIQYGEESSENRSEISYFSLDRQQEMMVEQQIRARGGQDLVSDMESNDEQQYPTPVKSATTQNSKVLGKNDPIDYEQKIDDSPMKDDKKKSPEMFRNLHKAISITKKQPQNYTTNQAIDGLDDSQFVSNFDDTIQNLREPNLNQTKQTSLEQETYLLNKAKNQNETTIRLINNDEEWPSDKQEVKSNQNSKRYFGPNTIGIRDYIPIEESVLNYKLQILEDIGKHKKIYLRKDKMDFIKPAHDILEQRAKRNVQLLKDEAVRNSVNYLSDLTIKPYQKKCTLILLEVTPNEEQLDILSQLSLEASDLKDLIQKQYNKFFISNVYLTGTLSITIQNKLSQHKKNNTRRYQSYDLINEENENILAQQLVNQYLQFDLLSKGSNPDSLSIRDQGSNYQFYSSSDHPMNEGSQGPRMSISMAKVQKMRNSSANQKVSAQGNSKRGAKSQNEAIENQSALRKKIQLSKKASKDAELNRKIIIKKLTKDATRSQNFRTVLLRARSSTKRIQFYPDVPDSDEEDQKENKDDDEFDDYLDSEFNNNVEIMRSKKNALSKKISSIQWSGQDILQDFDPVEANNIIKVIDKVRVWPYTPHRIYKMTQYSIKSFVSSNLVENLMTLSVLFNTICLAIDRFGIDAETQSFLKTANTIFTYVFVTEMSLKIMGLGIKKYLRDKMNYMDGGVVLLSMVEVFMDGGGAFTALRSIRIFRTFRVLRITRLLRTMKQMTIILNALLNSLNALIYLFLLVFLMLFIFALIGMQIYGNKMIYEDNQDGYPGVPRQNYDTFYWSFQTCFQLFTQENWQVVLADTLRAPSVNKGETMLYHIAWMTVGNTILLNLLMGIMLDSLGAEEQNEDDSHEHISERLKKKEGQQLIEYFQVTEGQEVKGGMPFGGSKKRKKQNNQNLLDESFEFDQEAITKGDSITFSKKKKENFEGNECELSFYVLSKSNPMRIFLYKLQGHFLFEWFIQFVILLSSIKLVVDSYQKQMSPDNPFLEISNGADYFFTVVFALESLIKSLSLGFMMDKGTYIRDTWSQLDFFIVVTALIDASLPSITIPVVKVLRLLRTLRPLRVISHNSAMKNIIGALIHSVSGIFYVAILLLIVWIMFAILAVNLMGGKLYSCSIEPYQYFTADECVKAQGQWQNFPFNYDNVGIALISLFDISTMENWPDQRNAAIDISGNYTGPIRGNNPAYAYYYNLFVLIGTYIFLNLFIGVIFIKFQETQNEEIIQSNLNLKQQRWLDMMKMIVSARPELETTNIPKNKIRKAIHSFITGINLTPKTKEELDKEQLEREKEKKQKKFKKKSKAKRQAERNKKINKFEIFVMGTIVANMIHLCLNYEGASQSYMRGLNSFNYVFTIIFIIEAILKLIAFGPSYFKNTQNNFDLFIVLTNIIDVVMNVFFSAQISKFKIATQLVRVFRILRLFRLYRLVKKFKGLNAMMDTIMISLPTLMSTFALLMLVYFIFAVLANFLFGDVTVGDIIDDYTNFSTFGKSMMTLIRSSTGEDWNNIMMDCGKTSADGCVPGISCGSAYNYLFFITFEVLQGFIMLNLFVLVITQQFDKYYMQDSNVLQMFKQDLAQFKDVWTSFTFDNQCIKIKDFKIIEFFAAMYEPLGMLPEEDSDEEEAKMSSISYDEQTYLQKKQRKEELLFNNIIKNVVTMDLDSDADGYVYFNELLFKTMKRIYGEDHEKNWIVIEQELKTLKMIKYIKEMILKNQRKEARLQALTVNPFVSKMFKNISFKMWLKLYKQNMDKRLMQKVKNGDVAISEAEEDEEEGKENENYIYETEKDETCSEYEDDDDEEDDNGSLDLGNINNLNKEINQLSGEHQNGFNTQRQQVRATKKKTLNLTQQNFNQGFNLGGTGVSEPRKQMKRQQSIKTPKQRHRHKISGVGKEGQKDKLTISNKEESKRDGNEEDEDDDQEIQSIINEFDGQRGERKGILTGGRQNSQVRQKFKGDAQYPKISIESMRTNENK